jgi:glycosyltransferase involved in cell wall biosynthesis
MGRAHDLRSHFTEAGLNVVDFGEIPKADPIAMLRALRYFKKADIDILHNHLPDSQIVGRIAGRLAGINTIISTHHSTGDTPAYQSRTGSLERMTRRLDSAEIAVSNAVKESLATNSDPNWCVIPNAIDVVEFAEAVNQADTHELKAKYDLKDGPVFLNIGRYVEQKGQEYLIAAMEHVQQTVPNASLLVVGWGDQEAALRRKIQDRGLEDSVFLTGRASDVHPYYAVADASVLSSVHEGFGIVLLEAMVAGLPVVSTDIPGPREVVSDAGTIVPARDSEALSRAMTELSDKSTRRNRSQMSRKRVKQFDISNAVDQHVELYRKLSN